MSRLSLQIPTESCPMCNTTRRHTQHYEMDLVCMMCGTAYYQDQEAFIDTPRAPCSLTCKCKVCVKNRKIIEIEDCCVSTPEVETPRAPCSLTCKCKVCVRNRKIIEIEDCCVSTPEVDMTIECLCDCINCMKSIELGIICHCKTIFDTSMCSMIEPLIESRKFFKDEYEYDYDEGYLHENVVKSSAIYDEEFQQEFEDVQRMADYDYVDYLDHCDYYDYMDMIV